MTNETVYQTVGPTPVVPEPSAGITRLPANRTLMVTSDDNAPFEPQVIPSGSVEKAMQPDPPKITVGLKTGDSQQPEVEETFVFNNIASFSPSHIVKQSKVLQALEAKRKFYTALIKQLKNPNFQKALRDQHAKTALLSSLNHLSNQLTRLN